MKKARVRSPAILISFFLLFIMMVGNMVISLLLFHEMRLLTSYARTDQIVNATTFEQPYYNESALKLKFQVKVHEKNY